MSDKLLAPPLPCKPPSHRLALRRELLLDEIRRPGGQGAWRLRPRRARLVLAAAIFVLLAAVGTAIGVGIDLLAQQERFDEQRERIPGEPKRIGPLVEITSGPGWSLVAWRSDTGICLDFVVPGSSGGGCGFGVRGEPHPGAPPSKRWISGGTSLQHDFDFAVIDGVVAEEVARVEIVLGDGRVLDARIMEAPAELEANVDFFFLRVPMDSRLPLPRDFVRAFIAYGEDGRVLERQD